jgi:hypothetical protein
MLNERKLISPFYVIPKLIERTSIFLIRFDHHRIEKLEELLLRVLSDFEKNIQDDHVGTP